MANTDPNGSRGTTRSSKNPGLAGRAARWSATNRKKAIFGWLGFVVIALALGMTLGTQQLTGVDQFTGESHDAEKALDDAGLRPIEEVVLLKSDTLTLHDPEFQAATEDVTTRLSKVPFVEDLLSPLDGDTEVTADGHAALVNFVIGGDSIEAKDRVDATLAATAAAQAEHPEMLIEQFGGASSNRRSTSSTCRSSGSASRRRS